MQTATIDDGEPATAELIVSPRTIQFFDEEILPRLTNHPETDICTNVQSGSTRIAKPGALGFSSSSTSFELDSAGQRISPDPKISLLDTDTYPSFKNSDSANPYQLSRAGQRNAIGRILSRRTNGAVVYLPSILAHTMPLCSSNLLQQAFYRPYKNVEQAGKETLPDLLLSIATHGSSALPGYSSNVDAVASSTRGRRYALARNVAIIGSNSKYEGLDRAHENYSSSPVKRSLQVKDLSADDHERAKLGLDPAEAIAGSHSKRSSPKSPAGEQKRVVNPITGSRDSGLIPKRRGRPPKKMKVGGNYLSDQSIQSISVTASTLPKPDVPYLPSVAAHTYSVVKKWGKPTKKVKLRDGKFATQLLEHKSKRYTVSQAKAIPYFPSVAAHTQISPPDFKQPTEIIGKQRATRQRRSTQKAAENKAVDVMPAKPSKNYGSKPKHAKPVEERARPLLSHDEQSKMLEKPAVGMVVGMLVDLRPSCGRSGRPRKSRLAIFKTSRLHELDWSLRPILQKPSGTPMNYTSPHSGPQQRPFVQFQILPTQAVTPKTPGSPGQGVTQTSNYSPSSHRAELFEPLYASPYQSPTPHPLSARPAVVSEIIHIDKNSVSFDGKRKRTDSGFENEAQKRRKDGRMDPADVLIIHAQPDQATIPHALQQTGDTTPVHVSRVYTSDEKTEIGSHNTTATSELFDVASASLTGSLGNALMPAGASLHMRSGHAVRPCNSEQDQEPDKSSFSVERAQSTTRLHNNSGTYQQAAAASFSPNVPFHDFATPNITSRAIKTTQPKTKGQGALKRKILMDLVSKCSGVCPADQELLHAFTHLWTKQTNLSKPDQSAIKYTVKSLIDTGKLRQLRFSFSTKSGTIVAKTIVTIPEIPTMDPRVKDLQKMITEHYPRIYLPTEDEELKKMNESSLMSGHSRDRKESIPELGSTIVKFVESSHGSVKPTIKGSGRGEHEINPSEDQQAYPPDISLQFGQQGAKNPTSRTLKASCGKTDGVMDFRNPDSDVEQLEFLTDPGSQTSFSFLRNAETTKFGIPFRYARTLNIKTVNLLARRSKKRSKDCITLPDIPISERKLKWSREPSCSNIDKGPITRYVQREEIRPLQPKPPNNPVFTTTNTRNATLNSHQSLFSDARRRKITELKETGLLKSRIHPEPNKVVIFKASTEFLRSLSSLGAHIPLDEDSSGKEAEESLTPRRRKAKDQMPSLRDDLPESGSQQIGNGTLPKKRLKRGPRLSKYLNAGDEQRLEVAIIVIRTLTGGLDKVIDWFLLGKIFADKYSEGFLHARWPYLRQKDRQQIDIMQSRFQEMFPAAYEAGIIPPINFDDLDSYDWNRLIDWTMKNIDEPDHSSIPELPASREILDQLFEWKETAVERDVTDYYEFAAPVPVPKRIELLHRHPAAIPLFDKPKAGRKVVLETKTAVQNATERFEVAKTYVRATVVTPLNTFDPHIASARLSSLGHSLIEGAIQSLKDNKVIVPENKGRPAPGRDHSISDFLKGRLRKYNNINVKTLKAAAKYKAHLDKIFTSYGSTTHSGKRKSEPLLFSWHADDGAVLCVINLLANKQITVIPKDAPKPKFGMTDDDSYRTRFVDKRKLIFDVTIEPRSSYVFGNPIIMPEPPRPRQDDVVEGGFARIPLWYDIHDALIPRWWEQILCSVFGFLIVRPGVNSVEMERCLGPALGKWEIELVLDWLRECGVGDYSNAGIGGGGKGFLLGQWWWLLLGEGSALGQDGVGKEEGEDEEEEESVLKTGSKSKFAAVGSGKPSRMPRKSKATGVGRGNWRKEKKKEEKQSVLEEATKRDLTEAEAEAEAIASATATANLNTHEFSPPNKSPNGNEKVNPTTGAM